MGRGGVGASAGSPPDGTAGRPADSYAYLDTLAYRESHCDAVRFAGATGPEPGFEATWAVDGMTCVACAWVIEEVGKQTDGVREVAVDLMRREVHVRFDAEARLSAFAEGIGRFGYGVGLPGSRQDSAAGARRELVHLAIAGAIAGNTMMLTLPYYTGLEAGRYAALFGWLSLLLATISVAVPGRVFFRNALAALRAGLVSLDLPIGLGVAAAWLYSAVQTVRGRWHELYFDSLTVLVFALLVGRFFQSRAVERAVARARLLAASMPQLVHALREGAWVEVPPEAIAPGDHLRVDPGQRLPCDGRLRGGPRAVDLQVVTGEEEPRELEAGAELPAGTRAVDEALEVDALSFATVNLGEDEAAGVAPRREPMLADRLGAAFTASVISIALAAFAWWATGAGVGEGLRVAMTILIVACPCALGLATPVAASLTIAAAAREGILVREPSVIDRLGQVAVAVFDKTGTLTEGRPEVVDARWSVDPATQLAIRAALRDIEATSRHPVARGLVRWLEEGLDTPAQAPSRARTLAGEGIVGESRGLPLMALGVGAAARRGWALDAEAQAWVDAAMAARRSVVGLWNGRPDDPAPTLALLVSLQDAVRSDAAATLTALRERLGLRVVLLSGDHQGAVDAVAERLGIEEAIGDVDPEGKAARITALQASGPVVMVGDGYNDVPALRGASLAVTLASGTPGAIAASEVVLHSGGVAGLALLFERARRARRVIATTLLFAAAYNLLGIALAAIGWITPLIAALLMPLSSATVVSYAVWASRRAQRSENT